MQLDLILLVTSLCLLAFGQLLRISFGPHVHLYLFEPLLVLYIFIRYFLQRKQLHVNVKGRLIKVTLIFLSYMLLSWIVSTLSYSSYDNLVSVLYYLRLALYLFLVIVLAGDTHTQHSTDILHNVMIFFSFVTIIFSFVQYFVYPDLRNLAYLGWDPHLYRMFGTYFEPVIAAATYGLLFFYWLFQRNIPKIQYIRPVFLVLFSLMIALTYSRSAYIAYVFTLIIWIIQKHRTKQIMILIILCLAMLFLIPKPAGEGVNLFRTSTIESRWNDYSEAVKIWRSKPLLGIGYNHIRAEKKQLGQSDNIERSNSGASFHSSFLIVLDTAGVIGLILFIFLLLEWSQFNRYATLAMTFLSIMSLMDNVLLHPFILFLFPFLSGLIHPSDRSQ